MFRGRLALSTYACAARRPEGRESLKKKSCNLGVSGPVAGTIKGGLQLLVIVHERSLYCRVPHKGAGGYDYAYLCLYVFIWAEGERREEGNEAVAWIP